MTKPILPPTLDLGQALRSRRRPLRRSSNLLPLEQRFMFDGAAVVDAAHAADATAVQAPAVPPAVEVRAPDPARDNGKKEYVIVDTTLADYKALEAGVRAGVGIVEFDGSKDGLAQIAAWASTQSGIDAIHILSHGDEGMVKLGSTSLTAATLSDATTQSGLARLGGALAADGDLMLYGCDAGAGAGASALLDGIGAATGADVAASADATGAAALGGNWKLEAHSGAIDTAELAIADYGHLLATVTFTDSGYTGNAYVDMAVSGTLTLRFAGNAGVGWDGGLYGYGASDFVLTVTAQGGKTFNLTGLSIFSEVSSFTISWVKGDNSTGSTTLTGVNTTSLAAVADFAAINNLKSITFSPPDGKFTKFQDFIVQEIGANAAPTNSIAPAISGTAKVGNSLSASTGTWSDGDGDSLGYTYKWFRADDNAGTNATLISGATSSTYSLTTSEAHKYVRAVVTADDGNGNTTSANSAWTAVADSAPVNTVLPSLTGTAQVGSALTASNGTWTDADGDSRTYTYQWYRANDNVGTGSAAIGGATGSSYTPTTADAHKYVRVVVTASDGYGGTTAANANWTAIGNSLPNNSVTPSVSGTATVGNVLSTTTGTWSDADSDTLTYSYQWYRADDSSGTNLATISGATASTYTLSGTDAHKYVRVVVTANDGTGTRTANSGYTAVTNSAPSNSVAPAIGGSTNVGNTVTATTGTWSDADGDTLGYSYQWYRASDSSGTGQAAISGATGASYTLTSSDANKYVRVVVTANDSNGSANQTAQSSWAAVLNTPSVSSIVRVGANNVAASATSVQYTVTFSESVTGVDAGDFSLAPTGTATGTIASISGSGSTYTVTVNGLSGDGTLGLNLKNSGTGIQNGSSVFIAAGYTGGQTYTLDHTAPSAPSTPDLASGSDSGINTDDITNVTTPLFTGTAESGSTVKLYDTDGTTLLGTATATGGTWSIMSSALAAGSHTLKATATDSAGNTSVLSGGRTVTIDTAPPTSLAIDTSTVATSTAGAGATVATLSSSDSLAVTYMLAVGDGINDANNGAFTITGSSLKVGGTPLTAGTYKVYVMATDLAGNASYQAFTITAVDAPSVTSIVRDTATGVPAATSSVTYTVTFSQAVTGVDASDFTLTPSGTASGTITGVSGSGTTWTVTVGSLSGDGTLRLDLKNSGTGIQNGSSVAIAAGYTAGQTYTLDHTAPAVSTPDLASGGDSAANTDNITNVTTPTFTGTAESGSTVRLYDTDGTTLLGTATATGGNWSITSSALAAGSHTLRATATDAAGNTSALSGGLAVTIDTAPPTGLAIDTSTVATSAAGANATVATLSASDNLAVTYSFAVGDGTNDASNGAFTITGNSLKVGGTPLTAGTYKVYVKATDVAGNASYQAFTITAVDAPSVTSIVRDTADGVPAATSSVSYTVTFSQAVTGVDASDFTLTPSGTASGTITSIIGSGTTWTVTVGSLAGDGTLRLDLKDSGTGIQNGSSVAIAAGYTAGQTYTLDHTAPAVSSPDLASGSDSGTNTDDITNVTTPTFTGTAESGSTVRLYDTDGTTLLGTATATGGNWSITSTALAAGSHTLRATATDAAGNTSALSGGLAVTIDTTPPTGLAIDTSTVATSAASAGATVATLSASGGPAVTYSLAVGNGTNDANNAAFSITGSSLKVAGAALTAGTYKVYVKATDVAGNASYQAFTITAVDAPSVASIVRDTADGVPAAASSVTYTVTFSQAVTGVDASDFTLTPTGTASGTITGVSGSGTTWTVTVGSLSGDGTLRLDLKNSGTGIQNGSSLAIAAGYTAGQSYTLDHTAPAVSTPDLASGSDSGANTDNITNVTTPTFTGTADSGSTVRLYDTDGTTLLGTATATGGNWSITSSALAAGSHTLRATATDAAGNTSALSGGLAVTIDTAPPTGLAIDTSTVATSAAGANATVATLSASDSLAVTYSLAVGNGTNDADNGAFAVSGNSLKIGGAALTANSYKVYVKATDVAGNISYQALTINVVDAPSVSSIVRAGGAAATVPGVATTFSYTVTFSQAVTGLDAGDFMLTSTGSATGTITGVSGSGTTYTVTVGSLSGDGTLRLDLKGSGTGIQNGSSIAIAAGYAAGQTYGFDRVAPAAPSALDMSDASDSGASNIDNVTAVRRPTISGTAEAGSTVTLYDGATVLGTTTATGGAWSMITPTLADGSHTITATATDAAGNVSASSAALAITVDGTAPAVTGVAVPANGTYKAGQVLTFTVSTSEAVTVDTAGGTPSLGLVIGSTSRSATYVSGSGSTALQFSYTVQPGDLDANGIAVTALASNGATFKDGAGNALATTLNGVASTAGVLADAVAPAVSSVSVPANGTYYLNQNLDFTVRFSEAVTVDTSGGIPRIALTLDTGGTVYAQYVSGSGSQDLVFRHVVGTGELDATGVTVGALSFNGATLRDAVGNNADTTLNAVGSTALVNVDGSVSKVTGVSASTADGAYRAGSVVTISVAMSRPVVVDTSGGTPTLVLNSGGTATYTGMSGSTLTFTYVVGGGENAADLDYASSAALALNGATIRDAAGTNPNAQLTLATPGTAGSLGAARNIVIDTVAPASTGASAAFSSDTGTLSTDLVTRTAAQTVSGTLTANLAAGETVQVSLDNGASWQTATAAAGQNTWSLAGVTLAAADTVKVRVLDAAGNAGSTFARAYVLDTVAPAITFSGVALSADTGASSSDFITNTAGQTVSATLSAPLGAGDRVFGSTDGGATWSEITAKVSGTTLSWDGATLAGSGTLKLRVTDLAGNDGAAWSQAYVLDTTAPAVSGASAAFSADSGASATDLVTSVAAQTVSGTLSSNLATGETVLVSLDNGATWSTATATAGQNTWSLAGQALSGSSTLQVKVRDAAGNDGAVYARAFAFDTTAPATTFSGLALSADTGVSASDFITSAAAQTVSAALSAPLAAGERVFGSLDGGASWTDITTSVSGTTLSWSGVTLPASGTIRLKVVDLAGNDGASVAQAYTVDTTAPATTATTVAFSSDTGSSASDLLTNIAAQTIGGKLSANLAAGETVWVSLDNGATWSAATSAAGQDTWSLAGQTLAGSGTLRVRVADAAGNTGPALAAAYVLDTSAPSATGASVAFSADSGASASDLITNVAAQTISGKLLGTLGAGEAVMVSLDDGTTWTQASVAGDSWTLAGQVLAGSGTLKARVVDAAGNTGAAFSQAYVLDQAAPAIAFTKLGLSRDTGDFADDFITNVAEQTVRATLSAPLAAGEKLLGSIDGGATWTDISAKLAGTALAWDGITLAARGTIALKVVDAAGNEGVEKRQDVVLDRVEPTMPTVDKVASSSLAPVLTGSATLEKGENLTVSVGGATYAVAVSGTSWSLDLATAIPSSGKLALAPRSVYDVTATVTDAAGNTSSDKGVGELTIGAAPVTAVTSALLSADSGASATDFVTNTASQTVSGSLAAKLEPGDVVQVSLDGGTTWRNADVFAVGSTSWSANVTLAGSGVFAVRVSNAVGQGPVLAKPYVLDTLAPAAPSVTSMVATSVTPVLSGSATLQAGETLTVGVGGATYKVAAQGGTWSLDLSSAVPDSGKLSLGASGTYDVTATVTDLAGNATGDRSSGELVINAAPVARVTSAALSADTGASASDFVTRTASQTVSGSLSARLAAGEFVEVSSDGGASWTRATAAAGADSWSASVTLSGNNTFMARVGNGNGSSAAWAQAYVLDTSAPAVSVASASITSGGVSGTLSGPLANGEAVQVSLDAGRTWQVAAIGAGGTSWSVAGEISGVAKVRLVDAAGNESGTQELAVPTPPVQRPAPAAQPPVVVTPQPPAPAPAAPAAPEIHFLPPSSPLAVNTPVADPGLPSPPPLPAAPPAVPPAATRPAPAAPDSGPTAPSTQPTLTQASAGGSFQALVVPGSAGRPDMLVVNSPIADLTVRAGSRISVQLSADTFAHTNPDAVVTLEARRADGAPLPAWLAFNAQTGQFSGTPPAGFNGAVEVRVIARDSQGNEAVQVFKILVGKDTAKDKGQPLSQRLPGADRGTADGRSSLTQQLRGARAANAERMAALSHSAKVAARRA